MRLPRTGWNEVNDSARICPGEECRSLLIPSFPPTNMYQARVFGIMIYLWMQGNNGELLAMPDYSPFGDSDGRLLAARIYIIIRSS